MFQVFSGCKGSKNVKDYESPVWVNNAVEAPHLCLYPTFEEADKYARTWAQNIHPFILNEPYHYSGNFYIVIREVKIGE